MSPFRLVRWSTIALLTACAMIVNLTIAVMLTPGWNVVSQVLALVLLAATVVVFANDVAHARERQRVIQEISREMAARIEMGELLDYVVHVALSLVPLADKCVIHLLDEEGRRLYPRHSSQPDWQQQLGLPAGKGIAGRALRENATVTIDDVTQDKEFLPLRTSPDPRSLLVAPLRTEKHVLGTISLNSHVAAAFSDEDQTLMTILAAQISSALHQSLLLEQAQREQHYVESVLMGLPDGIAVIDDQSRLARYNTASAYILGADAGRLVGKPVSLNSEEIGLRHLAGMITPPDDSQADIFTRRMVLDDPVSAIVDVTVSIILDYQGKRETIVMIKDQTEAVERIQAQADLMAAATREIMPGLASIRGYAALLRGSLAHQPSVSGWAAEIQTRSNELADRTRDLDFLQRLYAHQVTLEATPIHLAELLDELQALVQPALDDKQMTLEVALVGTLERGTVLLDGDKLAHALHNLLTNAVHRGYRGGQIDVQVAVTANDVSVSMTDDGRALHDAERERIFYGTFRADDATSQAPAGTGLALYVSRGLVEAMGGHLWLEQHQIIGVKTTLVLPRQQSAF